MAVQSTITDGCACFHCADISSLSEMVQSWKTGVNRGWKVFAFLSEMGNLCLMSSVGCVTCSRPGIIA